MLCARSFNPHSEDGDESEHEEANEGEVPVWTDSESEKKLYQSIRIQVNGLIHAFPARFNEERFIKLSL